MKKGIAVLLSVCALSVSMAVGIFIGRNWKKEYVPMPQNTTAVQLEDTGKADTIDVRLDLNTATLIQLMELPGIGEVTAQKILDYRDTNGLFRTTDDLLNIDGIGQKKLQAIEEYIKVGG